MMSRLVNILLLFLVGVVEVMGVNPAVTPLPPPVTPARGTPGTTTSPGGGYYETETQVFHEDLAVVGVPFVLHYSSRRHPGYGPGQAVYVNGVGEGNGMTKVSVGLLPGVVGAGLDEADLPVGLRLVEGAPEGHSLSYVIRPEAGLMWPEAVTVVLRYDWEITDGTHEASLSGVMKRALATR